MAGIIGGIVNAIAGGATLITFPAMLAAGLPALAANASNAVAVTPGHLMAALADHRRLPALDRRLAASAVVTIAGGAMGAGLLLVTPERFFTALVPALIGIATLIFAFGPRIQATLPQHGGDAVRDMLLLPTAMYGGYFGAGLGVMLLAVLTVAGREEFRAINALKNLLATAVSLTTLTIFAIEGLVHWPETFAMLTGALAGGVCGGRLIAVLPPSVVRLVVIVTGLSMTVIYAFRYWF
ncbi:MULTISPECIES: sulfite exporter TauE/SafE family protein [unclassified Bradyrhizobium]|uniref:sulfite exporter TauE/SafE family protein n=1 Tax=unclassified Bradyrhizobium TaxID=2631580 RepID=UPI001FEEE3C6|nr:MULTISPECIES: sulfite exporter TauE/SafE family protein [unclassified Bradyrhizobium]